jgi:hypothetical protein
VLAAEPLAQVLGAGHEIGAVQGEAAPVFQHPQTFPGPIEIGVEQAQAGGGLMRHEAVRSTFRTLSRV